MVQLHSTGLASQTTYKESSAYALAKHMQRTNVSTPSILAVLKSLANFTSHQSQNIIDDLMHLNALVDII